MGFVTAEVEAALSEAVRLELLNDGLFAHLWVENRLSHHPLAHDALRRELAEKGIASETIDETLSELCPREKDKELALRLAQEHFARQGNRDPEARARRTVSYLTRRGFSVRDALGIVRFLEKRRTEAEDDADADKGGTHR